MTEKYITGKSWLADKIQPYLTERSTVLDLGCGIARDTKYLKCKSILYVDVWEPYLLQIKGTMLTLKLDIRNLDCFLENSYDVVLCLDVIEHFEKDEAMKLLKEIDKIKIIKSILWTPENYFPMSDGSGWGSGNPKYQKHRCGFSKEELEDLGYVVENVPLVVPMLFAVKSI